MNPYEQAWKMLKLQVSAKKRWTQEELQQTLTQIEAIAGITSA